MYDDLEATLHDVFWADEGAPAELTLIENFLEKYSGTALELGCGSGRLLSPLLEKGFLIEGLDNSPAMLKMCMEKCTSHEPMLHAADMGDFSTGSTYSAITIPAFTLQFVPPEQLPDLFSNIHHHLHPDGGLYISTFIPWAEITGDLEENIWYPDHETSLQDGRTARCSTRFKIERLSQRLTREHRYEFLSESGKVIETSESTHQLHWFWPNELTRILGDAGFEIEKLIGDFNPVDACDEDSQITTLFCSARGN